MQTYGNFTGGYRPHLDSQDFVKTLRAVVSCAFLLAVVFSVKGASTGMRVVLNTNLLLAISIATGLTATAASLAFSSLVFSLPKSSCWGFRILSLVIFVCLSSLNYLGFEAAEEQGKSDAILQHSEVVAYDRDIAGLVARQNQYGVSPSEKQSLLAREREVRGARQELIDRLRHEKAVNPTVAARALGENEQAVRLVLAMAPDVMIVALLPLLAYLLGVVGIPLSKSENRQPDEKQIIYVQAQPNGQQVPNDRQPVPQVTNRQPEQPGVNGGNGKLVSGPIGAEQKTAWNPFDGVSR